ncbi:MAG: BamA/TamA family outer membrane protein, partial [Saprospiraceae bacterium]|nr:BamA/TamA family outer membrane protein [Saprospiraceae bacterium]
TQDILFQNGKSTDILSGSKILVGNFEVRVPFTGPKQLALIGSKAFFSELAFFFDAGIAFDRFDQLGDDIIDPDTQLKIGPDPVMSAGASLRINLFGMMVLEPYYAFPIQKETKGVFGLNIVPGW